jgi:hypothetical protein
MASNPHYSQTYRHAALDALTTAIGTSGKLRFYDGTQPTNAGTALGTQVLLADLALSATFAPAASGGVLTANAITSATIAATGTCTWCTLTTSANSRVADFSAATANADFILNSAAFSSGATCSCSSLTLTFAA